MDQDGRLSKDEIGNYIISVGFDVDEVFATYDTDGDGFLDVKEFVTFG